MQRGRRVVRAAALAGVLAACASPATPIEHFVAQPHLRGVPYAEAHAYGDADVPYLVSVLGDPARAPHWPVAVTTLAIIGTSAAVDSVVAFIESNPPVGSRLAFERARRNAMLSLGYAANDGHSAAALEYLLESLDPHVWERRAVNVSASSSRQLTEQALLGLALAGTPESAVALRAYAADPHHTDSLRAVATAALDEHARVVQLGLDAYDRARFLP
jgi:hypothetical protein